MRQPAEKSDPLLILTLLMSTCSHTCRGLGSSPSQVAQSAASAKETHAGTCITCGMGGGPTDELAGHWALKGRHGRHAQVGVLLSSGRSMRGRGHRLCSRHSGSSTC